MKSNGISIKATVHTLIISDKKLVLVTRLLNDGKAAAEQ